jgi:hypothetical protein
MMLTRILQVSIASFCSLAMLGNVSCSECAKGSTCATQTCSKPACSTCKVAHARCEKPAGEMTAELPPNARPGECYTKVWIPPEFKSVTERVLVKEASERLEIIPAKYETVEERVCVKDASKELREIPAEYKDREMTVQVESAHTDWIVTKDEKCTPPNVEQASLKENGSRQTRATHDVFCLVDHPPRTETLHVQCQAKPPCVKEEVIPAQYETIRRQKLVSAASTRRICIPAEYRTVEKTVKVCDGRMAWQKVQCEDIKSDSARANSDDKATYARR